MEMLINIVTDGQGSSVVSARELYDFLEVKSRFNDWIKNRIIKYGFREDQDYVAVSRILETEGFTKILVKPSSESSEEVIPKNGKNLSSNEQEEVFHKSMKNPTGGRPETDYALTLGMAKELAMVEGNAKGKQARQYFIACEEMLQQVAIQPAPPTALSTEQVLLQLMAQSNQLLASQQQQLDRLRADMDAIMSGHKPISLRKTPALPAQQLRLPGMSDQTRPTPIRQMISRRISEYCGYKGATMQEAWNYLYGRLLEVYGISVYRLPRIGSESLLDAAERYGHLDKLYSLITAELNYSEE